MFKVWREKIINIKEILVLHHSHFDIGYTHPQPIIWNLQYDFINEAINLLDETEKWSSISKPAWTCEVTAQVLKWMELAGEKHIRKFKTYIKEGRIGIGGMQYNTTPLCNAEQLVRQLEPVKKLRELFEAPIKTVIQHDVNGMSWNMSDILIDCGIELLIMGINIHQGGTPIDRPLIFRWQSPSGREIRVFNGEQYTMFDQMFKTYKNDAAIMEKGIQDYMHELENKSYPYDFIFLTSTNIPVCWDNNPPDCAVADMIRRWNKEGRKPIIRYITPDRLNERIRLFPDNLLPVYRGDWTDYWNFGSGSSAYETALNQNTKGRLFAADFLNAFSNFDHPAVKKAAEESWYNLNIYDEHTWGNDRSMEHDHPETRSQWIIKANSAYKARELSEYYLVHELESLAKNPEQSNKLDGVLVLNLSSQKKVEVFPVPEKWKKPGKKLATARFRYDEQLRHTIPEDSSYYSIEMEPYSWVKIPFTRLDNYRYISEENITTGKEVISFTTDLINYDSIVNMNKYIHYIETPYHRLEYDPDSGRLISLRNKNTGREIIDNTGKWTFFQVVREIPDPLYDSTRESYYKRDLTKLMRSESCWNTNWKARREAPEKLLNCSLKKMDSSVKLIREYEAGGLRNLKLEMTFYEYKPDIDLTVSFFKEDYRDPESIYLVFPLNFDKNWKASFDTAGGTVELDREQLPGVCRDWVTAESWVSLYNRDYCITLSCPDTPMAMFGYFNYGRKSASIPREKNPLLISWIMNNYWQTNFRASQPGKVWFHYTLRTEKNYSAYLNRVRSKNIPLLVHPVVNCDDFSNGKLLELKGNMIELLHLKKDEGKKELLIRLLNQDKSEQEAELVFLSNLVKQIYISNPFGENVKVLNENKGRYRFSIPGRRYITIKAVFHRQI